VKQIRTPRILEGVITVPGDKSISHRALIFNALATGKAYISGLSTGSDIASTIRCLRLLGTNIETIHGVDRVFVEGKSGYFDESRDILDCGNSGTTMRLMAGLLSGQPILSILTGDESLRSRPMGRIVKPLEKMGATVIACKDGNLSPLVIKGGNLKGIEYTLPIASAQVKSSILLAGLKADGPTVLHQPALSRDHTERMFNNMGVSVQQEGTDLIVCPGDLQAADITIPGDISSAAFWLVGAICHPNAEIRLNNVGVNSGRTGILEVLERMGANVSVTNERCEGGEPVADLIASSSSLESIEIDGDLIPRVLDELPVLALAASFAKGTTIVKDAQELREKESDRIATTVEQLSRLGVLIEGKNDGFIITGSGKLSGGQVYSGGDHRLAMCLGIAGLLSSDQITIEGDDAAVVSYPEFWEHLAVLSKA